MSLPIAQISLVDLDEDNPYFDLQNDLFSSYQARLNVNANYPRVPTFLSDNHRQSPSNLTSFSPWQPSHALISLDHRFQTKILYIFLCVPCSHCSILMFPSQAKWASRDLNINYDLCQAFSNLSLTEHPNKERYIAVYASFALSDVQKIQIDLHTTGILLAHLVSQKISVLYKFTLEHYVPY
ncbi:15944_t:CDS:2 [Dentiscutata erythropus]|uniref:15944_t:CDS:1 n=1 Tax=Dentiscutata erythropus TaxID=1348616 RepID=A0A9N9CA78_9GLOM|nr:15944_t:CDS:2 [Dentiscutata erythropus]